MESERASPTPTEVGHGNLQSEVADHSDPENQCTQDESDPSHVRETKDPLVVDWDGPGDPENPMNWSATMKATNLTIISVLAFLSPLGSTVTSPVSAEIMQTFHSKSLILETFITSIYLFGYVIGPLVMAPLSELYGRLIVYNVCNFGFLIWTIACAVANNLTAFIIFRLLAGIFGSAGMVIGAGTVADMVAAERRGVAMMGWILGPVLGPTIGPLIAAYIGEARGWRWVLWFVAILAGAVFLGTLFFMQESYAYVILQRKTRRLRKETGNPELRSVLDNSKDAKSSFSVAIIRPFKILILSPIVLLLSLYMATLFGYQYLMYTTFPRVFQEQYGFPNSSVGLVYLGIGVGFLISLVFTGLTSDRLVQVLARHYGGEPKPEYRLPALFAGAIMAPVGLFLYGWSAENKVHWIVPIIGSAFVGGASFTVIMPSMTYLVDIYTVYAASASAAALISRSLAGALLPLAGNSMYDSLGVGWGTSVLGFIAVVFMPVPLIFWKYGERIRKSKMAQIKL